MPVPGCRQILTREGTGQKIHILPDLFLMYLFNGSEIGCLLHGCINLSSQISRNVQQSLTGGFFLAGRAHLPGRQLLENLFIRQIQDLTDLNGSMMHHSAGSNTAHIPVGGSHHLEVCMNVFQCPSLCSDPAEGLKHIDHTVLKNPLFSNIRGPDSDQSHN